MNSKLLNLKSTINITFLNCAFLLFSLFEIYAEFSGHINLQFLTKPLLIPIIISLYYYSSSVKSKLYLLSLFFSWLANLFFMSIESKFIMIAALSFLINRILIIVEIFKSEKSLGLIPVVLGGIPFLFFFLSLISMVYENIAGGQYYLIVFQTVLMTILGGFSLGNYIINHSISSKMLLISTLFFGVNLFILGIKIYYIDLSFLKPMSMIFFVIGHYMFYIYMILKEKK